MMTRRTVLVTPADPLLMLLGGVALGAIVMALVTPKAGRDVRKVLGRVRDRLLGLPSEEDALDDDRIEALFI